MLVHQPGDDQVGAGAHQRAHAAEDGGVVHRQQQLGWGDAAAPAPVLDGRGQDDHDRRVVDEGGGADRQQHQQRQAGNYHRGIAFVHHERADVGRAENVRDRDNSGSPGHPDLELLKELSLASVGEIPEALVHHRNGLIGSQTSDRDQGHRFFLPVRGREAADDARRDPEVRLLPAAHAEEIRGRDADDPDRERLRRQHRADDVAAAIESAGPETIADDRDRLRSFAVVVWRELSTANRQLQHLEIPGRDAQRFRKPTGNLELRPQRRVAVSSIDLTSDAGPEDLQSRIVEANPWSLSDGHHPLGIRKRHRPDPERVDDREHQQVDADRDGEYEDRHHQVSGMTAQQRADADAKATERIANVRH